jgi:predicted transcriptional regulator
MNPPGHHERPPVTDKAITRKRADEVIACLTAGMSQLKTAAHLGISPSTVVRIVRENRDDIEQARREQSRRVAEELRARAMYAATRLEQLMDSPNDAVAISAIRTALSEALRWGEQAELTERLEALEQRLGLKVVS